MLHPQRKRSHQITLFNFLANHLLFSNGFLACMFMLSVLPCPPPPLSPCACMLSCLVVSDSMWFHRLLENKTRQKIPWNFLGKNTGVGCQFLLQGLFLTQRSALSLSRLLHWQADPLPLRQLGNPSPIVSSAGAEASSTLFCDVFSELEHSPVSNWRTNCTSAVWMKVSLCQHSCLPRHLSILLAKRLWDA